MFAVGNRSEHPEAKGLDDEDANLAAPVSDRHKPYQKEDADGMLTLNVGGIKYHTTLQTLAGFESMLSQMVKT